MITAIVRFDAPAGATLESVAKAFESTTPIYQGMPGLVRKYYIFDAEAGAAGGVYLWESRARAEAVYDDVWRNRIIEKFGNPPRIEFFETPVIVDNAQGEVTAPAAE